MKHIGIGAGEHSPANTCFRSSQVLRRKSFDAQDQVQKIKNLVAPDDAAADLNRKMIAAVATAGNDSPKMSRPGSNSAAKDGIKVSFDYFKANAHRVSASIKPGDHAYHLHVVELHHTVPKNAMTLA